MPRPEIRKHNFPKLQRAETIPCGSYVRKRGGDHPARVIQRGMHALTIQYLHSMSKFDVPFDHHLVMLQPNTFSDQAGETLMLTLEIPEDHQHRVREWARARGYQWVDSQ